MSETSSSGPARDTRADIVWHEPVEFDLAGDQGLVGHSTIETFAGLVYLHPAIDFDLSQPTAQAHTPTPSGPDQPPEQDKKSA
jgi:hypothetical protein